MNGASKENHQQRKRVSKMWDSTMSRINPNGRAFSRNLEISQRQGQHRQRLLQSFISQAGNGDRVVKELNSEPSTDQALQGQQK
jgi:hypothetical protein